MNVLQGEIPKPLIIYYQRRSQQAPTKAPIHPAPKVMIKVPTPFRYTSDKAFLGLVHTFYLFILSYCFMSYRYCHTFYSR